MLARGAWVQLPEPGKEKCTADGFPPVPERGAAVREVAERRAMEKEQKTLKIVIPVEPRTKKNSQQLVKIGNRIIPIPSKQYKDFEKKCGYYLQSYKDMNICDAVNVCCLFYMPTKRKVDLTNLQEAVDDMLVHFKVLEDDNMTIVAGHDGSRVRYDKEHPRIEITITKMLEGDIDVKLQKMRETNIFCEDPKW